MPPKRKASARKEAPKTASKSSKRLTKAIATKFLKGTLNVTVDPKSSTKGKLLALINVMDPKVTEQHIIDWFEENGEESDSPKAESKRPAKKQKIADSESEESDEEDEHEVVMVSKKKAKKKKKAKRRKRRKKKKRSHSDSSSSDSDSSDSSSEDETAHAFSGTLHSSLTSAAQGWVRVRKYVHFQYATSYAFVHKRKQKLIFPNDATQLLQAVQTIANAHGSAFPEEADLARKYCEELLFLSKILTLKGLFLMDYWCRSFFAESKCAWYPIPASLGPRVMSLLVVHRIPDVYKKLCFTCGDPLHQQSSCALQSRMVKPKPSLATNITRPFQERKASSQGKSSGTSINRLREQIQQPASASNVEQCYNFLKGKCSRSQCRYAH